jgi:hypothetical protein
MQQERDRVVVAFVAHRRAAQASTQAAEIRQQLAVLQAEIQSMQPSLQPSATLSSGHPADLNNTNPRIIDLKSPLAEGIQASP